MAGRTPAKNKRRFEIDLPVRDRNNVGGNVGGDVARLGFDDRQSGQRTGSQFVAQLGRTLQQAGVVIENIAGISFTSRGTAQQQGHLAVGGGLLGQIVVNDEGVLAIVAEVFPHGRARVRPEVLQGGRVAGAGCDDGGILHGAVFFEHVDDLGHRGFFLPRGHVDTVDVRILLGQDGVDRNGGFTDLAVADDELALTATDRCHGVDRLQAGVAGFVHALAGDDTGSHHFDTPRFSAFDGALAVNGFTRTGKDPAEDRLAHGHLGNLAGPFDDVALLDAGVIPHDGDTDIVLFEVEHQAQDAAGELHKLHRHGFFEAVDAGDTVTDRQNDPGFAQFDLLVIVFDLLFDNLAYFFGF
jgi:hypothetical protein